MIRSRAQRRLRFFWPPAVAVVYKPAQAEHVENSAGTAP